MMKGFVKYLIIGRRHSSEEHGAESDDDRHEAEDGFTLTLKDVALLHFARASV
jgi:hypothetical protein